MMTLFIIFASIALLPATALLHALCGYVLIGLFVVFVWLPYRAGRAVARWVLA